MVIGKKEAENKTVSVRRLGSEKTETFKIDEILKVLFRESLPPNSKEQS
jgi:threonyl-tRNA synthetase